MLELFASSLSSHAVEQVLKVVPLEKSEEFYHLYLHDFVSHLSLDIEDTENGYKVTIDNFILQCMIFFVISPTADL